MDAFNSVDVDGRVEPEAIPDVIPAAKGAPRVYKTGPRKNELIEEEFLFHMFDAENSTPFPEKRAFVHGPGNKRELRQYINHSPKELIDDLWRGAMKHIVICYNLAITQDRKGDL